MTPARRALLTLTLLLGLTPLVRAASLSYSVVYHADDTGNTIAPDAHDDSTTFGTTTATLPTGSSTSTLASVPGGFTFTASQSRPTDAYAWVHTLTTVRFTPTTDAPLHFTGGYDVLLPPNATPTTVTLDFFLADTTTATSLLDFHLTTTVTANLHLPLNLPPGATLLAGHEYVLSLEAFNEGSSPATGNVSLQLSTVPLPSAATAGLTLLLPPIFLRRRQTSI